MHRHVVAALCRDLVDRASTRLPPRTRTRACARAPARASALRPRPLRFLRTCALCDFIPVPVLVLVFVFVLVPVLVLVPVPVPVLDTRPRTRPTSPPPIEPLNRNKAARRGRKEGELVHPSRTPGGKTSSLRR